MLAIKFKQQFCCKAKMLTPEQAQTLVGHAVGGVCPFAINNGVEVFLDVSLKRFEFVYPACGSANSAIKIPIEKIARRVAAFSLPKITVRSFPFFTCFAISIILLLSAVLFPPACYNLLPDTGSVPEWLSLRPILR